MLWTEVRGGCAFRKTCPPLPDKAREEFLIGAGPEVGWDGASDNRTFRQ